MLMMTLWMMVLCIDRSLWLPACMAEDRYGYQPADQGWGITMVTGLQTRGGGYGDIMVRNTAYNLLVYQTNQFIGKLICWKNS